MIPLPSARNAVLAGCLVVLALGLAGCGSGTDTDVAAPTPSLVVTAAQPETRDVERTLVVSGSVGAWQEMSLGVELTGNRVAEVLVEVGDNVRAGQPLLRLDARTLTVQARQAEASVAQARASLQLAEANARRGKSLAPSGLISASNWDELQADLRRAEAQLVTAEADRDAANLRLGFATLLAPDAGVVAARSVQPGQVVSAGAELLRLIRRGRLEWRAELSEADLIRVTPGTLVSLAAADGQTVAGRVRAVAPAVDPETRTGLLYADLPEPGPFRAGMFAEGRILLGTLPARVLPREAIVVRDGFPYVFVLQPLADGQAAAPDGKLMKVEQRRIKTGAQQGEYMEVLSGLKDSEQVVLRGAGFMGNGDVVRVVPAVAVASPAPAKAGT